MAPLKRPAAGKFALTTAGKTKKKKTAEADEGAKGLNQQVAVWKAGVEETDAEQVGEGLRDKGKGVKWAKMKENNQIPDHVMWMYQNVPKGTPARQYRTALINKLFTKTSQGNYMLCTNDVFFKQGLSLYNDKYKKDENVGVPRKLFIAKYFGGNKALFEESLADGEVTVVQEDGKDFCSFRKLVVGTAQGSKENQQLDFTKKVDAKTAATMVDLFSNLKWSFNPSKSEASMLDQGDLVNSAKKLLNQAISANEKLAKEALKLIQKEGSVLGAAKLKELKQEHQKSNKNITDLQHIQNFEEMPDGTPLKKTGFDSFMVAVATDTQNLNQCIQTSKGLVKAAKN